MVLNMYNTLVEAVTKLETRGYTSRFQLKAGRLVNVDNKQGYYPQELQIVEYHRFEGINNPADNAIIFAVETPDKRDQGTVTMNYSSDGNMDLYSFMDKVKIKPSD
jgi:hypothetical protein